MIEEAAQMRQVETSINRDIDDVNHRQIPQIAVRTVDEVEGKISGQFKRVSCWK